MGRLAEIASKGKAAVLTMEMQRGVIGDLAVIRALADIVASEGIPKRLGGLVAGARRAGVPVVHCRAAFRRDRKGSFFNIPLVNRMLEDPNYLVLGEPAADVIPELGPDPRDLDTVRTHGMSPFHGTNLDMSLRSLGVQTVVIHPVEGAAAATKTDSAWVDGPFTAKPLITTGAGDHFNAGFMVGQLLGLSPAACLTTAVSTSGHYVRTAQSPSLSQLVEFIGNWK